MFVEEWIKYTCIFFTELKKSIAKKKEIIYIYKTNWGIMLRSIWCCIKLLPFLLQILFYQFPIHVLGLAQFKDSVDKVQVSRSLDPHFFPL